MENNNFDIKAQIDSSETSESIKNSTIAQLKIADDIMKSVENIPELRDKFKKEYQELRLSIIDSIKSEKIITNKEFEKIKSDFFDIQNLNIQSIGTKIKIEKKQLNYFENKKMNKYTKNEAFIALKYLQNNYKTEYSEDNILPKSIENYSINNLSNKDEVLFFQKKLINIITGTNNLTKNGFQNDYILGINEINGFYISTINQFKNKLKSINNISSLSYLEIKNYLTYINKIENYGMGDIENTDINILEKYIPKHLINNFIKKYKNNDFYQASTNEIDAKYNDILLQYISGGGDIIFIDKLISIGKTKDEIIIIISEKKSTPKNNLIKKLTEYKEEHKEYYEAKEKEKIELNKVGNKQNQTDFKSQEFNTKIFKNHNGSEYNTESGILTFESQGEKINLKLSKDEKKIIESDPLSLDNIINFYDIFKELNMLSVWKYRNDLITSMGEVNINWDDDSLKEDEIIRFGNHLINFINNMGEQNSEQEKRIILQQSNTLGGIKNQLRIYSGAQSDLSDDKTSNIYGEDRFANDLRNLGIIGNSLGFKRNKFKKISKGKIKKQEIV